jgi:antitoxin component of MazEF toxin-antitoxin module
MTPIKVKESTPTIRFNGQLQSLGTDSNTTTGFLTLPKTVAAQIHISGSTKVEGILNGFPFRAPIEHSKNGDYRLMISKPLLVAVKANIGDEVIFEVTRVGNEPEIRIPVDLQKALSSSSKAQNLWKSITPMARREWILWICTAKQHKTRDIRIKKACSMLSSGKKRVCCFGGINWLTKDHPKAETWAKLR